MTAVFFEIGVPGTSVARVINCFVMTSTYILIQKQQLDNGTDPNLLKFSHHPRACRQGTVDLSTDYDYHQKYSAANRLQSASVFSNINQ